MTTGLFLSVFMFDILCHVIFDAEDRRDETASHVSARRQSVNSCVTSWYSYNIYIAVCRKQFVITVRAFRKIDYCLESTNQNNFIHERPQLRSHSYPSPRQASPCVQCKHAHLYTVVCVDHAHFDHAHRHRPAGQSVSIQSNPIQTVQRLHT